jgi:hypothetical protein
MNTTLYSSPVGILSCGLDPGYFLLGFAIYRTRGYAPRGGAASCDARFLVVRLVLGPAWIAAAFKL